MEDNTMNDQAPREFRVDPIQEKDLMPEAMVIFCLIIFPAMLVYILITCYCRRLSRMRKVEESKQQEAQQNERVDTEMGLQMEHLPTEAANTERIGQKVVKNNKVI